MINGLDHANYNQLSGLYELRVSSISTDDISYDEISTLNNIDTSKTIQSQLNDLQTTLGGISLTISGDTTLSGVILKPYLEMYYDNKTGVNDKITASYNSVIDTLDNYVSKVSISGALSNIISISDIVYNTISSQIYTSNNNITTLSNNIYTSSNNIITLSNNIYSSNNNITTLSNNISNNIITLSDNIISINDLIYNTISNRIKSVSDVANTGAADGEYSRKQIDTQGTLIINLLGEEI